MFATCSITRRTAIGVQVVNPLDVLTRPLSSRAINASELPSCTIGATNGQTLLTWPYSRCRWNGNAWSSLGKGSENGVAGFVTALAASGGDLYAGGFFPQAGDSLANNVASWNGTAWSSLGSSNNGVEGTVNSVAIVDGDIYVGGLFYFAGGQPSSRIAKWTPLLLFADGFEGN